MQFLRRIALATLLAAALAAAAPGLTQTQKFPSKPIRLVTAFTPGGTTDVLARMIAPGMSETWGQALVIENRPGAGGTLAATIVAKAAPDGYTLLATSGSLAINAAVTGNAHYDPLKDFSTVGELGYATTVLVVSPSLGVKTLKEFIALASTKPIKLLFGSVGAGSSTHLSAERFRLAAGIKAQHVGFKGQSEFVIEIVTGRIHFGASGLVVCLPFIRKAGSCRWWWPLRSARRCCPTCRRRRKSCPRGAGKARRRGSRRPERRARSASASAGS